MNTRLPYLYAGQEAIVRTGHGTTDWFQIGKGVHQGCILSPCLHVFNLHAEYIMCNAGDLGSTRGLGRSPGEVKGYLLHYSGLENSMDCIVHGVSKSWTRLSNFYFHFTTQFTEYILNFSANPLFPLKQREETLCSSWLGFLLMQGGIVGKSQGSPSAVVNGSF